MDTSTMLRAAFLLGFAFSMARPLPQGTSPREVLEQFCELDARGEQLSPDGWRELAKLFVAPTSPQLSKIVVVRDYVVSQPAFKGKAAEFYVEYISLGQLDPPTARFSQLPTVKVRSGFDLVLTGPTAWRIEGTPPEPHLTVEAAIRYVSETREKTNDATVKKNAEKSLASLNRLRE